MNISSTATLNFTGNPAHDALLKACLTGNIKPVKEALKSNTLPLNFSNSDGMTPLMMLSLHGQNNTFEHILKKSSKENVHKVDNFGCNALHYACKSNDFFRVRMLYEDYQVEVLSNNDDKFAVDYTKNIKIDEILHQATQDILNNRGMMLKKWYHKTGGDSEKMEKLAEQHGLRIKKSNLKDPINEGPIYKCSSTYLQEIKKESNIKGNTIENRKKIANYFYNNPPETTDLAIGHVWENYGFRPTSESINALLVWTEKKRKKNST